MWHWATNALITAPRQFFITTLIWEAMLDYILNKTTYNSNKISQHLGDCLCWYLKLSELRPTWNAQLWYMISTQMYLSAANHWFVFITFFLTLSSCSKELWCWSTEYPQIYSTGKIWTIWKAQRKQSYLTFHFAGIGLALKQTGIVTLM